MPNNKGNEPSREQLQSELDNLTQQLNQQKSSDQAEDQSEAAALKAQAAEIDDLKQQFNAAGAYHPFTRPDPQATIGLNASFTYGELVQAVVGSTQQYTLGSNLSMVINPMTLAKLTEELPGPLSFFAAGGEGGNLQFVLGANASVLFGPQYTFTWGKTTTLDISKDADILGEVANGVLAGLIGALLLAWIIAYHETTDENDKSKVVTGFQICINVLVATLVAMDTAYEANHTLLSDAMLKLLFSKIDWKPSGDTVKDLVSTLPTIMSTLALPAIEDSANENHFNAQRSNAPDGTLTGG